MLKYISTRSLLYVGLTKAITAGVLGAIWLSGEPAERRGVLGSSNGNLTLRTPQDALSTRSDTLRGSPRTVFGGEFSCAALLTTTEQRADRRSGRVHHNIGYLGLMLTSGWIAVQSFM